MKKAHFFAMLFLGVAALLESASGCAKGGVIGQGGSASGSSGTAGACGGEMACTAASDCPAPSACLVATCNTGCCGTQNSPIGTSCTEAGGTVCDGKGSCVAMHCTDALKDADETDVDCGGSCAACADHKSCKAATDCVDKVCDPTAMTCTPPSCTDGVQNGTETDKDCGGPQCDGVMKTCAAGQGCSANADCTSGFCQANKTCGLRPDGSACTADAQCADSHCVGPVGNQICCNTACNGTCQGCTMAETGQPDGQCGDFTAGTPAPAGQCAMTSVCGNDGKCAAGGVCEQVPNCTCSTNLALSATASMSSGGSGTYGPQNINDGLGQSMSCNFAWVSSSTTPGSAYFELDWPSAVTIRSIYVDTETSTGGGTCAAPSGRNISSGDVQWWNGSTWVTSTAFSGKVGPFQLDLPAAVSTTKLRIFAITNSPGNGNAMLFEWHVYSGVGCMPPP